MKSDPVTPFAAWEARVWASPSATVTAKALRISRAAVYQLRSGASEKPHPGTQGMMDLLERNPELLRQHGESR